VKIAAVEALPRGRRGEDDRSAALLIAVAVVAFPLLLPRGPGGITPADAVMSAAILGALMWAGTYRVPLRLPYLVPIAVLVMTGSLAAMFSLVPEEGALAVAQDIFLLVWAAAIANVIRVPENLSIILAAWAWGATFWASALIVGTIASQSWLVGVSNVSESRGQLWFDNPNLAGSYFVMSLFVLLLGRHPGNHFPRVCACLLIFFGLVLTGSNGALLSLVVGCGAAAIVGVWRRSDLMTALATGTIALILIGGLAYLAIDGGIWTRIEESSNGLVDRSLGRGPQSAAGREQLYSDEFELYRSGSLLGRGPASTEANLEHSLAGIVEEAHDDYLATLVERGVIGVLGLVLLIASIGVMGFFVVGRPLSSAFARRLTNPSAIVGGVVAMAVFSTTHEILHYRHVWAFLGILAGLYLFGRESPSDDSVLERNDFGRGRLGPA
jgi:O-Antigen ligase